MTAVTSALRPGHDRPQARRGVARTAPRAGPTSPPGRRYLLPIPCGRAAIGNFQPGSKTQQTRRTEKTELFDKIELTANFDGLELLDGCAARLLDGTESSRMP